MAQIKEFSSADLNTISRFGGVSNTLEKINGVTVTADSFTGLLDTYTAAAAAYSVRRLSSSYTGPCMRVRRNLASAGTGHDDEADVAFDTNGEISLDSAVSNFNPSGSSATTLGQFLAASGYTDVDSLLPDTITATVSGWYDQSGNSNDATQSTPSRQPQIYNGTAVITENGKPALDFDNDELNSSFNLTSDQTVAAVVTSHVVGVETLFGSAGGVAMGRSINNNAFYQSSIDGDTDNFYGTFVNNQQQLHFVYRDSVTSTNSFGRVNGTEGALDIDGTGTVSGIFAIGQLQQLAGYSFDGFIQELILWNDQSSNRTGIEDNINAEFGIY